MNLLRFRNGLHRATPIFTALKASRTSGVIDNLSDISHLEEDMVNIIL